MPKSRPNSSEPPFDPAAPRDPDEMLDQAQSVLKRGLPPEKVAQARREYAEYVAEQQAELKRAASTRSAAKAKPARSPRASSPARPKR